MEDCVEVWKQQYPQDVATEAHTDIQNCSPTSQLDQARDLPSLKCLGRWGTIAGC